MDVVPGGGQQLLDFSDASRREQERHREMLDLFEQSHKARQLVVPTDDALVKLRLRELGQPICLFGEQAIDRRTRLRDYMIQEGISQGMPASALESGAAASSSSTSSSSKTTENEVFYTEGTPALQEARLFLANYSLPRAQARLLTEKRKRVELMEKTEMLLNKTERNLSEATVKELEAFLSHDKQYETDLCSRLKTFSNCASQIGDERPIPSVRFAPNGTLAMTGSWSGTCKLWDTSTTSLVRTLRGHKERVNDVVFHPCSGSTQSASILNAASCGADNTVQLWNLESEHPIGTLHGHADKVNRVAFHPSGRFIGSTSFDLTWRLWDIETQQSLLDQEGHSRAVTGIAFQNDGALVATTSLDTMARLWDLRTGRALLTLTGHVKQALCLDFSPNGYQFATGSDDHTVRIWDLRKKKSLYTIPAHSALVTNIRYQPGDGKFLVTSAFDNVIKVWNTRDWSPIVTLAGHEGKVMGVDISPDSSTIISSGFDRTWKLWRPDVL